MAKGRSITPDADRQLLFGLLAFHEGLIDREQITAAWADWSSKPTRSLAEILHGHGWLSSERVEQVEQQLREELEKQQGDVGAILRRLRSEALEFLTTLAPSAVPPSLAAT